MDPTLSGPVTDAQPLSIATLFLHADPLVKGIMGLLLIASLACWTIIVYRGIGLALVHRRAKAFEAAASDLPVERPPESIEGRIVAAGLAAWRDVDPAESRAERRERYERAMRSALSAEMRRLHPGLAFLATTGSTAPFVGLLGTVWGIMNSFSSIAQSQDTSLAVVAPGIAEALFATAIGLVAAIPAVVAYNRLTGEIARVQQAFAAAIATLCDGLARARPAAAIGKAAE